MKTATLAALIALAFAAPLTAAMPPMPSPIQAKADMEKKIVDEVSGILDRFLGPGRAHVTVFLNVEVKSPLDDGKKNDAAKDKKTESKWMWREISRKPKMSVLPGFAVNPDVTVTDAKDKKAEPKAAAAEDAADEPAYELVVRKMLISIVLDSTVNEKNQKMIEVMVSEVLGLDPDRGDRLNVYKLPLQPAWKWALETPETLLRFFWGAVAILALAALLFFITRSIQSVMQARSSLPVSPELKSSHSTVENGGGGHGHAGAGGHGAAAPSSETASVEEAEKKDAENLDELLRARLDFVTHENFEMLSELLKGSDPKEVSCLLGFVDPVLASRILDQLPQDKRLETLMYLVAATSIPPQELAEIKRAWRERLAFAYGGTGAVGELLSAMDPSLQKAFLERLKVVSPELAPKVAQALIRMEDLSRLDAGDLAIVAQAVPFEDWAKALLPMPVSYKNLVLGVLPDSSRQVLQQWLSLTNAKKGEIVQSQAKVLGTMRSLLRQGRIAFGTGAVKPVAAPAPAPSSLPSAPAPIAPRTA